MLWKLFDNFTTLKNSTNSTLKPDVFTTTYFCVPKCGCISCVHKFVGNVWNKISLFLRVSDDFIIGDVRMYVGTILAQLC